MNTLQMTEEFEQWLRSLGKKDLRAQAKVLTRLDRACNGNFGDCSPVGQGLSEMRITYGAGYRVYFMKTGNTLYLFLGGGDKSSQSTDIREAKILAEAHLKPRKKRDKFG